MSALTEGWDERVVVAAAKYRPARISWRQILFAAGPGLVAMLADTDASSIITAAQSGIQWGYQFLLPNLLFIPFMFVAQDLASRLGLGTGQGAIELVVHRLGRGAAVLLLVVLSLSCLGALVSEMSGLAGVGAIYGLPRWLTMAITVSGLVLMVVTGSYRSVERVALFLGLFELAFVAVAWNARPGIEQIILGVGPPSIRDPNYLYLLAANLGTSIVPWTLLYQQSASVDKKLDCACINGARLETFGGIVLCQIITSALIILAASLLGHGRTVGPLETVQQIGAALGFALGTSAEFVFILGLMGGALVATIVVCLTLAWTFGEASGVRHSLEHHPCEAPWFYGVLVAMIIGGGVLAVSSVNLIDLTVGVGVINALLLPIVLGFLYWLGRTALPDALRLKGISAAMIAVAFVVISGMALYAGLIGCLS